MVVESGDSLFLPSDMMSMAISGENRTILFGIHNSTPFKIKIAFGQILCRYEVGPPYINDTGVFTLCADQYGDCVIDPIQRFKPIAGTSGSISISINGQRIDDAYPEVEDGKYWAEITWRIGPALAMRDDSVTIDRIGVLKEMK